MPHGACPSCKRSRPAPRAVSSMGAQVRRGRGARPGARPRVVGYNAAARMGSRQLRTQFVIPSPDKVYGRQEPVQKYVPLL